MKNTEKPLSAWAAFALMSPLVLLLPLAGAFLAGKPVGRYLAMPPTTRWVEHAGFSPAVFAALALFTVAVVAPFLVGFLRTPRGAARVAPASRFPWWGWAGLAGGAAWWVLAWSRFPWFATLQMHTFTPLWISYILVINAWTYRRTGACMLTHRTGYFLALFPVSAAFWWFFEYLNRFVENWHYVGGVSGMTPAAYFVFATLPFSTVLPAVLGTREWLASFSRFDRAFRAWAPAPWFVRREIGWGLLVVSGLGLAGIARWPDQLFALVWVAPAVVLVGLQIACGRTAGLAGELAAGDWRRAVTVALAALICGFWWEMWNAGSLARWVYSVPYVHTYPVFEMPLLGYAGYLPFGLECLVIGDWVMSLVKDRGPARAHDGLAVVRPPVPAGM